MMVTVDGLVISRRDFGDASCYIDILTKEFGVVETAVKGVKKLNSPIAQAASIFTYSAFCFNKTGFKYTINSAKFKHGFHRLSADLRLLALAAYFAELIKFTATPELDSGGLLRLTLIAMYELCRDRFTIEKVKADFETGFAKELGFDFVIGEDIDAEKHLLFHLERESFKTLDYYKSL